ncbi:double-stranded RNA-binding protein 1 [Nicotiana tabacum]|uniref:Double-stranded RNA-binding protein 1 n=2 Tax=Nicotiana TaxID=4085 RepID=A0AC58SV02_TOBAC|nr:PREDICTED: double-stranded RNA-binding protein 1-like [Nicotiana sylvestris]
MAKNESFQGVSTCYVFKSRLQEYAQKVGFPTPVYEIIKDGPSHKPTFRSTVIVNNVRYDSLPGFLNRKTAEQSAAEVALKQLVDSGAVALCLSQPVHQTGLCKNMLQDYAQKMNFAIPQYEMQWHETKGKITCSFSCTVEIGGIRYIGGAATTKKEAEIKAARTALLAIQSSGLWPDDKPNDYSAYTVIPPMKKATDLGISNQESAAALKPKKGHFKKKKRRNASKQVCTKNTGDLEVQMVNQAEPELHENAAVSTQGTESGAAPIGGDMTERSAVTGVGQLTSGVDSSASCLEQQITCVTEADQGRGTNTGAEISLCI